LLLKCRLQRGPHDKAHKHTCGRCEEHGTTFELVDEEREADGGYEIPDGEDAVDKSLSFLRGDADGVQDEREVVLGPSVSKRFRGQDYIKGLTEISPLPDHCEKKPTARMMKNRSMLPRDLKKAGYELVWLDSFSRRSASLISSNSTSTIGS